MLKGQAPWLNSTNSCPRLARIMKMCHKNWINVTIMEFLSSECNLANNRQTRMLANFNLIGCGVLKCLFKSSNCTDKMKKMSEAKLLQSAKHTLSGLSFFGLDEYQNLSEYLFIQTFDSNKFKFQKSISVKNKSKFQTSNSSYLKLIQENNHLDIKLYEFAKEIFFRKVQFFQGREIVKKNRN
jgi:hypothetical protein